MLDSARKLIHLLYQLFEESGSYCGQDGDFGSQTAYAQAARENLIVILPSENQLFVDIDNDFQYAIYQRNLEILKNFYGVTGTSENPSKSGIEGKKHVTVSLLHTVEPKDRLILQAFLGSDLRREFLGLQRVNAFDPAPTLFLERLPEPIPVTAADDIPF